jgi:large subunit ribosomal protein L35
MAMSLSLARLALRPVIQSLPAAAGKRPANAAICFPANSFFGAPLAVAAATALSPAAPLPRSLAVVAKAGKGYKMKTHKVPSQSFAAAAFVITNPSLALGVS